MSERRTFEIPPERLARWLDRWAGQHAPVLWTRFEPGCVTFEAHDGAVLECVPPFPPLEGVEAPVELEGMVAEPLLDHARRDRTVGVLLVRLGGYAGGVFEGRKLVASKVGSRLVHGRHRKGGSSQRRFERRRGNQAQAALGAAADVAARILAPRAGELDTVVLGGDRRALDAVLEDRRLEGVRALAVDRVLDVPDPRRAVLEATPDRFRATLLTPR